MIDTKELRRSLQNTEIDGEPHIPSKTILSLLDKIDAQEKEIKALNKALDEAYP